MDRIDPQPASMTRSAADFHFQEASSHNRKTAESARLCGLALLRAKECCPHGQWLPSLQRYGFAPRTAQKFMKFAKLPLSNAHSAALLEASDEDDEIDTTTVTASPTVESPKAPDVKTSSTNATQARIIPPVWAGDAWEPPGEEEIHETRPAPASNPSASHNPSKAATKNGKAEWTSEMLSRHLGALIRVLDDTALREFPEEKDSTEFQGLQRILNEFAKGLETWVKKLKAARKRMLDANSRSP